MKHLKSYFATLTTIVSLFFMFLAYTTASMGVDGRMLVWLFILAAAIIFTIGLVIGHFLTEPLIDLHEDIKAYSNGVEGVGIQPRGNLYEADLLATDFIEVSEQSRIRLNDLSLSQKRQSAFISDVAHELRTPLTAIRGNAEIMLDPDMPQDMREHFLNTIISESERLTRMTNDLLTLQHIEGDKHMQNLERLNLHDLAESVIEAMEPLFEERNVHVALDGEAPDILGSRDKLHQVIYNLVANANRFVPDGGHIILKLEGVQGKSVLSVIDDGPGFGDIDPNLLFTRFFRGDNSRARSTGGTGLGLSIVKSVVESHDGTVEAVNMAQGGACFIVALPSVA